MGALNKKYTTKYSGKVTTRKDNYGNLKIVSGKTSTIKTYRSNSGGGSSGSSKIIKPTATKTNLQAAAQQTTATSPTSSYYSSNKVQVNKQIEVQPMFQNKFFSLAGQKERLANVGNVLKTVINPFSKARVVANVRDSTLKTVLEAGANNPYTTALIGASAYTAVKALPALGKAGVLRGGSKVAAKTTAKAAAKTAAKISTKGIVKAGVIGTGILGGAYLAKNVAEGVGQRVSGVSTIEIPNPEDPSGDPIKIVSPAGAIPPAVTYSIDPETGQEVPVIGSPDIGFTEYAAGNATPNSFLGDLLGMGSGGRSPSLLLPAAILAAAIYFKK